MRILRYTLCGLWLIAPVTYIVNGLEYNMGWDSLSWCIFLNSGSVTLTTGWWMEQHLQGTGTGPFLDKVGPPYQWFPDLWFHEDGFMIPSWMFFVGAFPPWFLLQRKAMRSKRRSRTGYCHHCGYNLKDNKSGICPECGNAIEPLTDENA